MKLVLVEWLDSHASRGWQSIEDLKLADEPLKCRSVGWLFRDDKDCKVILPHIAGEGNSNIAPQGCGDITIPTRSILKVKVLKDV